ncbi:MAG TPA: hydantoinase B/oxoprolinase family protein [Patescibacteria group bacterium]|nr:hydantoinase B/oxoprolinase family protein [Patescibacteria group bacterium]
MRVRQDPVLLELVRYGLDAVVDEMAVVVARTSRSATIRDALDYSTALCAPDGEVIAQGVGITLHLGSFGAAVDAVRARYGNELRRGDVFILNDPYLAGGIHLPDIYVIKPIFAGASLSGFAAVVAHHSDIGGAVAGSNSTNTTEIYQEGLRLPCLRLHDAGRPNTTLLELLRANVRVPADVEADVSAQVAAVEAGAASYRALMRRYGRTRLAAAVAGVLDQTEATARLGIAELGNGTHRFTTRIDGVGRPARPVRIQLALEIRDGAVIADFDGSSGAVAAGINCPLPFTRSAVYAAIRLVINRDMAANGGFFRPINVVAPVGSVVNPVAPAACGARGITGFRVMEAVFGALGRAAPERVPADGEGGNTLISIGGVGDDGRPFIYTELFAGARGGSARGDGPAGVPHPGSNNANMPVEVAEARYPIRFREYGLVPDSGGAGRHRGAMAQVREFEYLGPPSVVQIRSDKRRFPPYGLAGGSSGSPSISMLNPGTPRARILPAMGPNPIGSGDVFRHVIAGGGGWGSPADRPAEEVLADVEAELVSPEAARAIYAIELDDPRDPAP